MKPLPPGLALTLDTAPAAARAELAKQIHAFHAETVPGEATRFALLLHDAEGTLAAGIAAAMHWQWLFIEALHVAPAWRRQGIGQTLLAAAEQRATDAGCHSAWLDTFQARDFYIAAGYETFATLPDYPLGQTRTFLRKRLLPSHPEAILPP